MFRRALSLVALLALPASLFAGDFVDYTNKLLGFSLEYPNTWEASITVEEACQMERSAISDEDFQEILMQYVGNGVVQLAAPSSEDSELQPCFRVMASPFDDSMTNVDQIAELFVTQSEDSGATVSERPHPVDFGGEEALFFKMTGPTGDGDDTAELTADVYLVNRGSYFLVFLAGYSSASEGGSAEVAEIVDSFRFL